MKNFKDITKKVIIAVVAIVVIFYIVLFLTR